MRTVITCIPVKTAAVCSMVSGARTDVRNRRNLLDIPYTPQITNIIHRINRTEKVFDCKKTSICRTGKNPAKVIVSFIQIPIISIKCSSIGTCHTRQIRIHSTQKVKVYFKQIIVLTLVQIQFESHIRSVRKRALTRISPNDEAFAGKQHAQSARQSNNANFLIFIFNIFLIS